MGQDPTTVQVDYRVTRPLTNVLVLLLAQNAPLRWALSNRAIIPLPPHVPLLLGPDARNAGNIPQSLTLCLSFRILPQGMGAYNASPPREKRQSGNTLLATPLVRISPQDMGA